METLQLNLTFLVPNQPMKIQTVVHYSRIANVMVTWALEMIASENVAGLISISIYVDTL